jgi:hypothetical protein
MIFKEFYFHFNKAYRTSYLDWTALFNMANHIFVFYKLMTSQGAEILFFLAEYYLMLNKFIKFHFFLANLALRVKIHKEIKQGYRIGIHFIFFLLTLFTFIKFWETRRAYCKTTCWTWFWIFFNKTKASSTGVKGIKLVCSWFLRVNYLAFQTNIT